MTTVLGRKHRNAPTVFLSALLLLLLTSTSHAQVVCDNDGIAVQFKNSTIELNDVRVREITGNRGDELEVALANPGRQFGNTSAGVFTVNSLTISAFPDNGISFAQIDRSEGRIWEANYPKNMYSFADKKDLVLEFQASVSGGEASHIIVGPASSVAMSIDDAGIKAKFHGGKIKSLKQLQGDLDFRIYDLLNLTAAGIHRANVSLCVNVRGNI